MNVNLKYGSLFCRRMFALVAGVAPFVGFCAVRTVTIDSAANAYPTEDIELDSGSRVEVKYSYRGGAKTMKEALIDKIKVNSMSDSSEPYVAFVVDGDGLKNDVDFRDQPYLWLSSPKRGNAWESSKYNVLVGIFEPYNNTYKFGYGGTSWTGESGILVTNLVDNPVTGAPRNIVVRGKGTTCFTKVSKAVCTLTGTVSVEDGADFCTATSFALANMTRLVFNDGTRFVVKSTSTVLPAGLEVAVDGTVSFYVSGGSGVPAVTVNGNLTGSGTLQLTDQGGIQINGTNNTFTGKLIAKNATSTVTQLVGIGNGKNFSWNGSEISSTGYGSRVVLNADSNVTFSAAITTVDRLVKQGKGTLTLANPPDRSAAVQNNLPAWEIEGGTVALGTAPSGALSGLMTLGWGAGFDACGKSATAYLPSGYGKVANTGGEGLLLQGGWTNDVVFSGALACPAVVEALGGTTWRLTEKTSLADNLEIRSGTAAMGAFFATDHDVTVGEAATLKFNADDYWHRKTLKGLKVDFWDLAGKLSSGTHPEWLEAAQETSESPLPMYSTDMTEFPRVQNGDNVNGSDKDCPFAKVLGAYNATKYGTDPNYFAAVFSGFLHIEKAGTYQFRMRADDSGVIWLDNEQIIKISFGTSGNLSSVVSRNLTAGDHPFKVLFGEESGWEVVMVEIKGPDVPDWRCVPVSMLKPCIDNGIRLGALKGSGTIALEPNGQWPVEMPTDEFAGQVLVDGNTKPETSGTLALSSATLNFDNGWSVDGTNWTLCGAAVFDSTLGRTAIRATPGAATQNGGVNTSNPIPVTGPWSVEFDFSAVDPFSGSNIGDGFVIVLHNGGANQTTGGLFQYTEASKRINCDSAYGIQCFINRDWNYSVWMKNGNAYAAAGGFETNTTRFTMNKIKNHPMHMKMEYDGREKMIVTYAVDDIVLARTNACAGADLAALFPNGARLGVWAANGAAYASACINNLTLTLPGVTDAIRPEFGGTLELKGGVLTVVGHPDGVLSGKLAVTGAATLSSEVALNMTSSSWTFTPGTGMLSVSGSCRLADFVTVELAGEAPKGQTILADFSAIDCELPTAILGAGYPKKLSLSWLGRQLYLDRAGGMVLIFK